jgi:iron complex transport system substrate-binding protein
MPRSILRSLFALAMIVSAAAACTRGSSGNDHRALVRDDLGRDVRLPAHVRRIVSLQPNVTELIAAAGAADRIVGTDDFSDEPASMKQLPKVGSMQPNVETITSLRAELVLTTTSGNHPALAAALGAVAIPLYVLRIDRLTEIAPALERIGMLIGRDAHVAAAALRHDIEAQRRTRRHAPRVLFLAWSDPIYVAANGSFADDLLALTGAHNAVPASFHYWPQYSLEALIANPPDLIIYPNRAATSQQVDQLIARAKLSGRTASVSVDDNLFTRPGPRVAQAATLLNGILDRWEAAH